MQDSISDFIIRLKNATNAGKDTVLVPYSKILQNIAEVLQKNGYIESQTKKTDKDKRTWLEVELKKGAAVSKIKGVKRHSKPSKRVYIHAADIYPVKHGYGMLVVSTSKGVMTGDEARKMRVGGESLFEIW
ncbi:MAG TPA: 30S ribosomal protein S8 [Candidatus Paceibacterota bacterium]|nr:30S ribosomal protein S8 [Candidatus Paceibacterota bacterium]